jgi:hypothetical protein
LLSSSHVKVANSGEEAKLVGCKQHWKENELATCLPFPSSFQSKNCLDILTFSTALSFFLKLYTRTYLILKISTLIFEDLLFCNLPRGIISAAYNSENTFIFKTSFSSSIAT